MSKESAPHVLAAPHARSRQIDLGGGSQTALPEIWESMAAGPSLTGSESSTPLELWVRNVSRPTLEPFIPERLPISSGMIIVPGGGFLSLGMDREGYPIARWLSERGIAAFVLKHRLAPTPTDTQEALLFLAKTAEESMRRLQAGCSVLSQLLSAEQHQAMAAAREDASEAVEYVRTHAGQWDFPPDRIGLIGFSSGAVTAINVILGGNARCRPDVVACLYGMLPDDGAYIPMSAPPAFIAAAGDDPAADRTLDVYNAWRRAGASAQLHVFEDGGHGFGMLRQGRNSDRWPELLASWLCQHGFMDQSCGGTNPAD